MNANAKAIQELLRPGEHKIRLRYLSQGGLRVLPSPDGFLLPNLVPGMLFGKVAFDTFSVNNRPMRESVPAYLPGGGEARAPSPDSGQPKQSIGDWMSQLDAMSKGNAEGNAEETEPEEEEENAVPESDSELPEMPDGSLGREVAAASIARVRSETARQEASAEAAIERETMSVIGTSTYTKEVAEWQLISQRTKQEFYRDARRTQELAQRQVEQAEFASAAILRQGLANMELAEMLAQRLRSNEFQPAPPPKPQVDYGAVGIAGMQMLASFATALGGLRPGASNPSPPSGLDRLFQPPDKPEVPGGSDCFTISKARLLELADSKAMVTC